MSEITYPEDVNENFRLRAKILSQAEADPQFASAMRLVYSKDIIYWIATSCWIYDAKGDVHPALGYDSPHMLFIPFNYQIDFILELVEAIMTGQDKLVEKSRDMGASWIVLTIFLWFFLFQPAGNDFLLGSRKEEYVDKKGIMDSLFPKLRYQLYRQPEWILPDGFSKNDHDNYMRLVNPETGNTIRGEANNQFFGTGGRNKAALLDEFAKWMYTDALAWQSLSDTTNCKIAVSSAFGKQNQFYRLKAQIAGTIKVIRLHWKKHPLKDMIWYNKEKLRRSKEDLAAEVDINYSASVTGRAYESFSYDIHCAEPYPEYNADYEIDLQTDFNISPMCWALSHEIKKEDHYFNELVINDTRTEYAAIEFRDKYKNHRNKHLNIYGDATGKHGSTKSKESDYQIIKRILNPDPDNPVWAISKYLPSKNPPITQRVKALNKRLIDWEYSEQKVWIYVNPVKCPTLVDSFEGTKRKGDGIDKTDNIEHITDAVGYKAVYRYPIKKSYVGSTQR